MLVLNRLKSWWNQSEHGWLSVYCQFKQKLQTHSNLLPNLFLLQRLGCDNMLESPQQEDPCLQCGGNGQTCHRVQNSFSVRDLPTGTLTFPIITFVTPTDFPSQREQTDKDTFERCLQRSVGMSLFFFISGYNQMFIIPVGATTISIRETVATRNYLGETFFRKHRNSL